MYGQPAPQGSKKFQGMTKAGKGIIREASNKLAPWRNCVCTQAIEALDRIGRPAPIAIAVRVELYFTFLRPASVKRSKRPHMSIAPDLSKLVRATEDGLTDAGVWVDDALVVQLIAGKCYSHEAPWALDRSGCFIVVEPVVPLDMPPGRGLLELETGGAT